MRTKKEVESYLKDLKTLAARLCEVDHDADYLALVRQQVENSAVAIGTLEWVLGDASYDGVIEHAAKTARQ